MEALDKDHAMSSCYNESMEQGGDFSSVGSSMFTVYVQADHLYMYSAVIHGLTPNDPDMDAMYDQFGPTPRICFEFVRNSALLATHKKHQSKALSNLSVKRLGDID